MRRLFCGLLGLFLALCGPIALAAGVASAPQPLSFSLVMDKMPLQQLVTMFWDECEHGRGLVFDPSVTALDATVTLKTPKASCGETRPILVDALARDGVQVESKGLYDVVKLLVKPEDHAGWRQVFYRPQYRDPVELSELVAFVVRRGTFAHQRRSAVVQAAPGGQTVPEQAGNGASITSKSPDSLMFFGPSDEAGQVEALLQRFDRPNPQAQLSVGIYEYQSGQSEGSAVSAAAKLFHSKFGVSITSGVSGTGSVTFSLPSLDAALSLLDADNRFHEVSRPSLMVRDGEQVTFSAGQDVRVPGSVTVSATGVPVQSITTMTAGVQVQALANIRGAVTDLTLHQSVSDFVASPNADPSVTRREVSTRLSMVPGQVYVIGGLQTTRNSSGRQRLFGLPIGQSLDVSTTEIILLVSVTPDPSSAPI